MVGGKAKGEAKQCESMAGHLVGITHHQKTQKGKITRKICNVCGKSFSYNSNRKRRLKSHMGEKPYGCSYCSERFTQATNLIYTGSWLNPNRREAVQVLGLWEPAVHFALENLCARTTVDFFSPCRKASRSASSIPRQPERPSRQEFHVGWSGSSS